MKKVSSAWTLVPWLIPPDCWLARFVPTWVWDNVERAVYDGMTRAEWFANEIAQFHASQAARSSGDPKEGG